MPNRDFGHYFLTILLPVRTGLVEDGGITSHIHALRSVLARLPTARQSRATLDQVRNAPFARSDRTHFARLAILDDVAFNGRVPRDAVLSALAEDMLTNPQKVDHLACPYLIFVADFDPMGPREPVDYLTHLWSIMEPEWRAILAHCVAGDRVTDAATFAAHMVKCQLETTMPFNDYGIDGPPPKAGHLLPLITGYFASTTALRATLLAIPLAAALLGITTTLWIAAGLIVLAILAYRIALRLAEKPFPAAPNTDLRSILKSLYLQQRFTDFATAHQLDDDATRHAAFAEFLATHRPDDLAAPTQSPGVIGTAA